MADSIAILVKLFSILMLDQFSRITVQGASFYVERIELASKLKLSDQKWQWSRPFSGKSAFTNFQTLTHQISLLAGLHTLSNLFHYTTQKQPIQRHLSLFPMYFKFQVNLAEVSLSICY